MHNTYEYICVTLAWSMMPYGCVLVFSNINADYLTDGIHVRTGLSSTAWTHSYPMPQPNHQGSIYSG